MRRGISIPRARCVPSLGAVNCAIKFARRSPAAHRGFQADQSSSRRRSILQAIAEELADGRPESTRARRVPVATAEARAGATHPSDRHQRPSRPPAPCPGPPLSPAPTRSYSGSMQLTPRRLNSTIRIRPDDRQLSFQGEPFPGRFQDQRFRLQPGSRTLGGGSHQGTDELGDGVWPVLKGPADAERLAIGQQPGQGSQPNPRRMMPPRHLGSSDRLHVTLGLDPEPEIDACQSGLEPFPAP